MSLIEVICFLVFSCSDSRFELFWIFKFFFLVLMFFELEFVELVDLGEYDLFGLGISDVVVFGIEGK